MPSSDLKAVTLPEIQEMQSRLLGVIDHPYIERDMLPLLLQHAGTDKNGPGLVMMVQLCIHDSTVGLPPIAAVILQDYVVPIIEAVVDDEEVKAEALRVYDEVKSA